MEEIYYRIILAVLIITFFVIRSPSVRKASKNEKTIEKKPKRERFLVFLNFVGMVGIPFIYILTTWLDFFALWIPEFFRWIGIVFCIGGFILLIWIHRTLGEHWSMVLELGENQKLVTTGPYSRIRHPMYTFFYIFVISTALISANLFVGFFGIGVWTLLYVVRINDEEEMLIEEFGEEYEKYITRTGRLFPRFRKSDT
jgi:protein-S-isoprenylcysteine O-methyltransferase Ste14